MNEQRIKDRRLGRDTAVEVIDLCGLDAENQVAMQAMIKELTKLLLPPEPTPEPPKQPPFAQLETTLMPFGSHEGERFCDVPLDYLDWLCRSQEEFYKSLRVYLRHSENRREE